MDKKTILLVVILGLITMFWGPIMIFLGFVEPKPPTPRPEQVTTSDTLIGTTDEASSSGLTPAPPAQSIDATGNDLLTQRAKPTDSASAASTDSATDTIIVETNKYIIALTTQGAGPISIKLKDYSYPDNGNGLIEMLPRAKHAEPEFKFSSGQISLSTVLFESDQVDQKIDAQSSQRSVRFSYTRADGETIEKIYTFYPDMYSYDLVVSIPNRRAFGFEREYTMTWEAGLEATELDMANDYSRSFAMGLFAGGSTIFGEDGIFGGDWENNQIVARESSDVSWLGKRSKYFTAIMIPRSGYGTAAEIEGKKTPIKESDGDIAQMKTISVGMTLPITDNGALRDSVTFYVGPLDWSDMKSYDVELENMFDIGTTPVIGWLIRIFAIPIIWLLPRMYDIIPNYGMVIILLGVFIKLVTWPLSRKTVKSMAAMRELQPDMDKLKEKHKNNPQALQKATMKMYKEAGVNPLAGCLPMLPQMPLFFALFAVFNSTILFRGAPFMLWIDDLSRGALSWSDPYMALVILMSVLMFLQQKISMTDPKNKAMIYIMPVVFGFMFRSFSSGLVLYWTTFSAFSYVEQLIGNRKRARENRQVA